MKIKSSLYVLLFWASAAFSDDPARLVFSSAKDFTHISLVLKTPENPDPAYVEVNVTLSPEAKARTAATTLLVYQKYMTVYVDGYPLNTARVHGVLGGYFRISVPRKLVLEWMSQFAGEAVISQPTK
ncbi:hypothetical protein PS664_00954 [Pseudomonas fluorescens]|nr:hypothetical protein PS664_00954 [Pseudomonas fluorescens]